MKRMRKFALSLALFLFFAVPAFAQAPVRIYYSDNTGKDTPVSTTNPLPVNVLTMPGISVSPDTRFTFFGNYLDVVQKDTGINDAGGSLTVDNSNLDTQLTLLLAQLVAINGKTITPPLSDVVQGDTIYEITLTDTATVDSSIVLPAKCTGFELWGQTSTHTIRWMLTSGTYAVQPPGTPYNTFDKGINALYSGRLYLKDTTEAGAKVTVIVWTKP